MTGPVPHRDFLPPPTLRTRLTDLALVVAGCVVVIHFLYWLAGVVAPYCDWC